MHLVYIYRQGCDLCEDYRIQLDAFCQQHGLTYQARDVDGSEDLYQRYNEQVPVLLADGSLLNRYFFDEEVILGFMECHNQRE